MVVNGSRFLAQFQACRKDGFFGGEKRRTLVCQVTQLQEHGDLYK